MYTVYKITNNINEKYYIGVHKTKDPYDNYMGSGLAIKNAIQKYGKENFTKEVLLITEDKKEAFDLERTLTLNFVDSDNYNMKLGGIGGFTRENARKGNIAALKKLSKEQLIEGGRKGASRLTKEQRMKGSRNGGLANKGKPKSEEHKQKIKDAWLRKRT